MNRRSIFLELVFVVSLVAVIFLATIAIPEPDVAGEWQVTLLSGAPLVPGTNITIDFSEERISGFGGCNEYGGSYVLNRKDLRISDIEMTAEGCTQPPGVLDQETGFFQALRSTAAFKLVGEELILTDAAGMELARLAPVEHYPPAVDRLEGAAWVLASQDGELISADPPAEIRFNAGRLAGFSGCRHLTGTYTVIDDEITVSSLSMVENSCDSPTRRQVEDKLLAVIDMFYKYRFVGEDLEIVLKTGGVMGFTPGEERPAVDVAAAEGALKAFFNALVQMDYETAAGLYGDQEEFFSMLRDYNPMVDPDDRAALLEAACLYQFRCMPVLEIIRTQTLTAEAILFTVTFAEPDGSAFVIGACCGSGEPVSSEPTTYDFIVMQSNSEMKVLGGLVYVP